MHPLKELISSLTGQPSAKSAARTEAVQAAQTKAQAVQSAPAALPQQAPPAPAQTPVGSSTGFGQPSFLASAATQAPSQQNTAVKTLLGQ